MENKEINFEEKLKELDSIVEKISSQTLSIDESVKLYEKAKSLSIELQNALDEAKGKVETIVK